jgi:hypothetical protein
MTARRHPEQDLQRALCGYLEATLMPPAVFWHTPNGGARSRVEGAIFKGLGVKAGFPDIALLYDSQLYLLELKAPSGRLSDPQREMIERLIRAGARVGIAYSLEQAIGKIQGWGLPLRIAPDLIMADAIALDEQLGEAWR